MAIEGRFRVEKFDAGAQGDPMLEAVAAVVKAFAGDDAGVGVFFEHKEGEALLLSLHHVPADHPDIRLPKEPTP